MVWHTDLQRTGNDDLLQISNNILHGNPGHKAENTGIEVNAASPGVLDGNFISAVDTSIRLGKEASGIHPTDNIFRATGRELVGARAASP
jgi:hypothetical protein